MANDLKEAGFTPACPIEDAGWDDRLRRFDRATVVHTAGWARTLTEAYGHRPFYLVWRGVADGQVMNPVMECGAWLRKRCGVSLPFTDECPVLSSDAGPGTGDVFRAVVGVGRQRGWSFYQWNTTDVLAGVTPSVEYHTHRLDLRPGGDALFAGLEGATRRGVKKAQAHQVRVEFVEGPQAAAEYYRLHCLTRRRHGQPPQPRRFFEALGRNVLTEGRGFVAVGRLEGRAVAAAMFLKFGSMATYKFAASDQRYQFCRAGNLVMWEGIQRLVADGCKVLDLGRTSADNDGLRRFKKGWGAEERALFTYRVRVADGAMIPLRDFAHGWHTRLLRCLPVAALRVAGEMVYPYRV